jgi:hypothetical protein
MVKRTLTWGFVAFLIFLIAYRPASATAVFRPLGQGLVGSARHVGKASSHPLVIFGLLGAFCLLAAAAAIAHAISQFRARRAYQKARASDPTDRTGPM